MKGLITALIILILVVVCGILTQDGKKMDYTTYMINAENANTLPITTWDETKALAIEKYQNDTIWNCDGENMEFEGPPDGWPFPENDGMYGRKWVDSNGTFVRYSVGIRCMLRIDNRTRVPIMTFEFDPNDGKIQYLICYHDNIDSCPVNEDGNYTWIVYGRVKQYK